MAFYFFKLLKHSLISGIFVYVVTYIPYFVIVIKKLFQNVGNKMGLTDLLIWLFMQMCHRVIQTKVMYAFTV